MPDYFKELNRSHPLNLVDNYWFHQQQPVVSEDTELKQHVLQKYHNHALVGHLDITTTLQMVAEDYWWPTMKQFIQNYVQGCATCQLIKPNTH
jgi:Integrase zinc binding domain